MESECYYSGFRPLATLALATTHPGCQSYKLWVSEMHSPRKYSQKKKKKDIQFHTAYLIVERGQGTKTGRETEYWILVGTPRLP
jgi:hypothetical protein